MKASPEVTVGVRFGTSDKQYTYRCARDTVKIGDTVLVVDGTGAGKHVKVLWIGAEAVNSSSGLKRVRALTKAPPDKPKAEILCIELVNYSSVDADYYIERLRSAKAWDTPKHLPLFHKALAEGRWDSCVLNSDTHLYMQMVCDQMMKRAGKRPDSVFYPAMALLMEHYAEQCGLELDAPEVNPVDFMIVDDPPLETAFAAGNRLHKEIEQHMAPLQVGDKVRVTHKDDHYGWCKPMDAMVSKVYEIQSMETDDPQGNVCLRDMHGNDWFFPLRALEKVSVPNKPTMFGTLTPGQMKVRSRELYQQRWDKAMFESVANAISFKLPHEFNLIQPKETLPMNVKIETHTFLTAPKIGTVRADGLTDDQIFEVIADVEKEIKRLDNIESKPAKLQKRIDALQTSVKALGDLVDARPAK